MKYKITIEKIEIVKEETTKWQKHLDSEAFEIAIRNNPDIKQYGYVPTVETVENKEKIYEQTRDDGFDIKGVIDAFNV